MHVLCTSHPQSSFGGEEGWRTEGRELSGQPSVTSTPYDLVVPAFCPEDNGQSVGLQGNVVGVRLENVVGINVGYGAVWLDFALGKNILGVRVGNIVGINVGYRALLLDFALGKRNGPGQSVGLQFRNIVGVRFGNMVGINVGYRVL